MPNTFYTDFDTATPAPPAGTPFLPDAPEDDTETPDEPPAP